MPRFILLTFAAACLNASFTSAPLLAAPPPAVPPLAASPPAAVSTETIDLLPLKKALAPLAGEGPIQSQSTFHMTGHKQKMSFTFREDVQIIAKRPGRFHAELSQVAADGAPQKHLTVVSNGSKVWTYRPGTRQYSVTTYPQFQNANNDITALGLTVGGFYIGDGHDMAAGFHAITAANSAEFLAALTKMDVTLTRRTASVGGQDDYVYRMTLTKQGLTYQFYVDSATQLLQRVELTGTQNGVQIAFREDITQIAPQPVVPNGTFQFVPPPGSLKAPAVSVNPF